MRIVIVGCGKVGSTLAMRLQEEGHELTIIDRSERGDLEPVYTVCQSCCDPDLHDPDHMAVGDDRQADPGADRPGEAYGES